MRAAESGMIESSTLVGAEIDAKDWSDSSLGPPSRWPPALTALVSMMLACPAPMFLAWGPDLSCLYNDAYRPILGYRAATALGRPFREVWDSIWSEIEPLVVATMAGEAQRVVDTKLDLSREGVAEEGWWTFSYSPAYDDEGRIAGLFCVTNETTARVVAERERAEADERLQLALSAGNSIGAWDWDVAADRFKADARFANLYGVDPELAARGVPASDFLARIHPADIDRVNAAIRRTITTGGAFAEEYRLVQPNGDVRWVSAQGHGIYDAGGRCIRLPGVSFDVTSRMTAIQALRDAKAERDFVVALTGRQRALDHPDTIMRFTADALGERLGAGRVGFYRLIGRDRMRCMPGWNDGSLAPFAGEQSVHLFGRLAERQRKTGKVLVFADSRHDERGDLGRYAEEGVMAGVLQPLLRGGRGEAGLYVHHATVRAWSASEVALIREVAELTWLAVERAEAVLRLEERLGRQGEELVRVSADLRHEAAGRHEAEGQVRQLQKMEAVGQLTGGIAHDFNNMLAIIIGGLNLTQKRLARGDTDVGKYIDGAMEGATRAASLTQRLLAFSRQQPLAPETLDLNRMVAGLSDLLTRTLGEVVKLETVLGAGLWTIKVDPSQLENVVVNLAVNARDAMPDGGRLTIETVNAHVDESYAREAEIATGQYVQLSVSDTGTGMSQETMARAFDPFFTTKGVGKGTGLGLSQVFGFVRQSGGHVRIYSEIGHGSSFKVYLPRFVGEEPAPAPRRIPSSSRGGSATEIILVTEDENRVRAFSVDALTELGYTVLHAANGAEALAIIDSGQAVTLLFTDVVMPGMTGRQLADEALKRLPQLKVLFTTGYTRNAVIHNGVLDAGTNFLPKPFAIDQLAAKIRAVLDGA